MSATNVVPLSIEQAGLLQRLVATLSPEQMIWASGYLAGARAAAASSVELAPAAVPPQVTVLYGSETGHAAKVAEQARARATELGLPVRLYDMADYPARELREEKILLVVTSTHGDGNPPEPAAAFYEHLLGRRAPRLTGVRFSVLGLGDSTYEHFCKSAIDLDARLEALGGERIHPRVDCDVDFEEPAACWTAAALAAALAHARPRLRLAPVEGPAGDATRVPEIDAQHPLLATLCEALVLNGRGSEKRTLHLELSLAGAGVRYEPGDAVGVVAENDPRLVDELLDRLRLDPDTPVPVGAGAAPLVVALRRDYEITTLTPRFVERWAALSGATELRELLLPDKRDALTAFVATRQVIDLVTEISAAGVAAASFVGGLRRLQPRLYSAASSLAAHPDEVHLTVAVVRYPARGRVRRGVASSHLDERVEVDGTVPIFFVCNPSFKLPRDPGSDIVMIGAGTGVAPYRAFLEERAATGARGRAWLFFGDRRSRTDFLYQREWQLLRQAGVLSRMDVAFSRDESEKRYVQHRLRERARELFAWIEEGATIYVCGDAKRMAPDVEAALVDVLATGRGASHAAAYEELRAMKQNKRYQKDVY